MPKLPELERFFGEGWTESDLNTMGEFSTYLLLKRFLSPETAFAASAGWKADRYIAAENPRGQVAWLWVTDWDSDEDAAEFESAYRELLSKKYPQLKWREQSGQGQSVGDAGNGELVWVRIVSNRVIIAEGISEEMLPKIGEI